MRIPFRFLLALFSVAAFAVSLGCEEVPKGFGKGLVDSEQGSDSTDTEETTDTEDIIDTSNERTDPNQWPGYTWTYHSLDGCHGKLDYHVWEYDGEAEATVVFVNGRTEYTDKYHHIVTPMGKPWNIIMYDHYGHGRSEGVRTWVEEFESYYVCDMKKIVDEVAIPMGGPLLLLAHSMGAGVATRYLQLYPGVFESAALSSPMYLVDTGGVPVEGILALAADAISKGKSQEPFRPQPPIPPCETNMLTHDCELYDKFKEDPLALIGDPAWGWLKAAFDFHPIVMEDAALITEDIFIMQAGDEVVVVEEEMDKLCDALNEVRPGACTLKVYDDTWHELLRETIRQTIIDDATEFLSNSLAARRTE
jgi:lysophospholipase